MKNTNYHLTLTLERFKMARPSTQQKFTVAGISCDINGDYKPRFANDLVAGFKKRQAQGDSDIEFIELPTPMTKFDIVKFLKTTELYLNPNYTDCIDEADEKYNGKRSVKISSKNTKLNSFV